MFSMCLQTRQRNVGVVLLAIPMQRKTSPMLVIVNRILLQIGEGGVWSSKRGGRGDLYVIF